MLRSLARMSCVNGTLFSSRLLVVALLLVGGSCAQAAGKSHPTNIVVTKLATPTYPPIARAARIEGDVTLRLVVRPDGSVESADVVSGHPMLKQAAWDSASRSQFACLQCGSRTTYSLTYRFTVAPRDPPQDCDAVSEAPPPAPEIDLSKPLVTVYAWEMWTCDPSVSLMRVRSAKCLYLWKCERRESGTAAQH